MSWARNPTVAHLIPSPQKHESRSTRPDLPAPLVSSPRQAQSLQSKPRGLEKLRTSELLSGEPPPKASNEKAPASRPTTPAAAYSTYRISLRQQPSAARACGFGEKDRRAIDPPPIVQVTIDDPHATAEEISRRLRHPFSVVQCTIWNEAGDQDLSTMHMPDEPRPQRRLMGTTVASPFIGLDENDEEGCFFCFPDLSCRTYGSYRLKFLLVVLDPARSTQGTKTPISAETMSNVFTAYVAKYFHGMQASTALTKRLREQGCVCNKDSRFPWLS